MDAIIDQIVRDNVLEQSYQWVCQRRKHAGANSDIWDVRLNWSTYKPQLQQTLKSGNFTFEPVKQYRIDGKKISVWSAIDALVLKAMSIVLGEHLSSQISSRCFHLKGNGGLKAAINNVYANVQHYRFFMRTDVKRYYKSISHWHLMALCKQTINDPLVLHLLEKYMNHLLDVDGNYVEVTRGIALGCPLSPLMGALALKPLDDAITNLKGIFYVRYMDDWCILAHKRWDLKKAIKVQNEVLNQLELTKHPDKTEIGRLDKGRCFTFLGYELGSNNHINIAKPTLDKFTLRLNKLYEQQASQQRLIQYVKRWRQWCRAGLQYEHINDYCLVAITGSVGNLSELSPLEFVPRSRVPCITPPSYYIMRGIA